MLQDKDRHGRQSLMPAIGSHNSVNVVVLVCDVPVHSTNNVMLILSLDEKSQEDHTSTDTLDHS